MSLPLVAETDPIAAISKRRIRSLIKNPVKTAEAVNLIYLGDNNPGIERMQKGGSFEYYYEGKKISDEETLMRIKKLVIPPAWQNVWICPSENGHLQVTGIDTKTGNNINIIITGMRFGIIRSFTGSTSLALYCLPYG